MYENHTLAHFFPHTINIHTDQIQIIPRQLYMTYPRCSFLLRSFTVCSVTGVVLVPFHTRFKIRTSRGRWSPRGCRGSRGCRGTRGRRSRGCRRGDRRWNRFWRNTGPSPSFLPASDSWGFIAWTQYTYRLVKWYEITNEEKKITTGKEQNTFFIHVRVDLLWSLIGYQSNHICSYNSLTPNRPT